MKTCSICKDNKELFNFHKDKTRLDGYNHRCKECMSKMTKKHYFVNKEKILNNVKEYSQKNNEKIKEKYIKNKDKIKAYLKANKENTNRVRKIYKKIKIPHIVSWRRLLYSTLVRMKSKKEGKTIDLLGYSALDFKQHIESLFTEGMSWDNHGEWHVDHIKNVSSFNSDTLPSVVNSLSNLRPLWATTREINGVIYEGNLNRNKIIRKP